MIVLRDRRYGPDARNRVAEATEPGHEGMRATLESFYHALNHRDLGVLAAVWSPHDLAQLNNPLGGIVRGGERIVDLYRQVFAGRARLDIGFGDFVEYLGPDHAVVAGRETGTYVIGDSQAVPVSIRTSRYLRYDAIRARWLQFHHHGSIDEPDALAAYQRALLA